jgi:hypothetical protein
MNPEETDRVRDKVGGGGGRGFITVKLIEKFKIYDSDCSQAGIPSDTGKGKL